MAKPVIVNLNGATASFNPVKVDRSKIYGSRRRVAVMPDGSECARASLTDDGDQLLKSGMTSQSYFTSDERPLNRSDMVGIDHEGNLVDQKPSTLGAEQSLIGPIDPSLVLQLSVETTFFLEPLEGSEALVTSLKAGDVYQCPFNYAAGLAVETAYLVGNDEGIFAIVGQPIVDTWMEESTAFVPDETEEEDEDDLDFDLF